MTHTYALLEVSTAAYEEIAAKLRAAGYDHVFDDDEGGVMDMHGIGLGREPPPAPLPKPSDIWISTPDSSGWIVDNGRDGAEKRFRFMNEYGLVAWTADVDQALRFARRQDAESFSAQDEDAWCITPYFRHVPPTKEGSPMHVHISTTGIKSEVLARLAEPGSAGTLSDGPGVVPPNELETKVRQAIADHIQTHAGEHGNVRVTASISLVYPKTTGGIEATARETFPVDPNTGSSVGAPVDPKAGAEVAPVDPNAKTALPQNGESPLED